MDKEIVGKNMTETQWRSEKIFEQRGLNGQELKAEQIKKAASELWTLIDNISVPPGNSEAGRLIATALTHLEGSVMWAIKALSRNH